MIWENEIVEAIAAVEHEQWAHWAEYMLDNLNAKNKERWRRQIDTAYEDLTEEEKASDRPWALKALRAIESVASRETISTCRICEVEDVDIIMPHEPDTFVSSARWVTPWRTFEDPLKAAGGV